MQEEEKTIYQEFYAIFMNFSKKFYHIFNSKLLYNINAQHHHKMS
ncbi:hypothetical protein [Helicobacter trogontum]|nr:hypothetical protein [Helicobacter trogontum]